LCDLFTGVLDWSTEQVRLQESRVDILLTRLGVKYLIVEAKRPGSLDGPASIQRALRQAVGYAQELDVGAVAVSDGCVLEAHDVERPTLALRPRLRAHLSDTSPPGGLWWLSTRGIYRTPQPAASGDGQQILGDGDLLHPKYQLPARCFAYVGHPQHTSSWKLPYLRADGSVDDRRLPKAIQSVLRDYRGEQVHLRQAPGRVRGPTRPGAPHAVQRPQAASHPGDLPPGVHRRGPARTMKPRPYLRSPGPQVVQIRLAAR
jgi:hypothetical protein